MTPNKKATTPLMLSHTPAGEKKYIRDDARKRGAKK